MLEGVFHRRRVRKRRSSDFLGEFFALELEHAGRLEPRYYAPRCYLTMDRLSPRGCPLIFTFASHKAMAHINDGDRIQLEATVREWDNKLGGTLLRPRNIIVLAPATTPPTPEEK